MPCAVAGPVDYSSCAVVADPHDADPEDARNTCRRQDVDTDQDVADVAEAVRSPFPLEP